MYIYVFIFYCFLIQGGDETCKVHFPNITYFEVSFYFLFTVKTSQAS